MRALLAIALGVFAFPHQAAGQAIETRVDRLECRDSGGLWNAEACDCGEGYEFVLGEGCVEASVSEPPPPPPPPEPTGLLEGGTWTPIPGSEMRSIYDPAIDDQWDADGSPRAFEFVQDGWSGATCVGDELLLMGGGHGDGAHNGVFAVDVQGGWRRVTLPSPIWREEDCPDDGTGVFRCSNVPRDPDGTCVFEQCNPQPDGAPAARHTYYLLASDGAKLYTAGGSIWRSGNVGEQPTSWALDLGASTWEPLPDLPISRAAGGLVHVDGKLYLGTPQRYGAVFDIQANQWTASGSTRQAVRVGTGLVWVPSVGRIFAIGQGLAWSLPPSAWPNGTPDVYEPQGLALERYSGLTYYAPEDLILLWKGGPTIETLDPHTGAWGAITPSGDPGPLEKNGTFGRFSYCGGRLVLVNGVDRPLYFLDVPIQEAEPEPEPPPVQPPPPGLSAAPYYAHPPGDLLVERDCGPETEWDVLEVDSDEELADVEKNSGDRVLVRVHWRETPYGQLRVKGKRCAKVVGIPGPEGQRPVLASINATKQFRGEILPGGVLIENVIVSPGMVMKLRPNFNEKVSDCLGVPNDRQFFIVRDSLVTQCGHHSFVAMHAHHLYVEVGRSVFSQAGSHLAYINHVAMAWIYDSVFESPGWGHALRCAALRCRIERTRVSNIQFDGGILLQGENPLMRKPLDPYIGMHPLEVYTCGENELIDVEALVYADRGKNIGVAANLRDREGFHTCDVGEVVDGQWTPLEWGTDAFVDPDRWATTTDLVTRVENFAVRCIGPDAEHCRDWALTTSYPWADDPQKAELKAFLKTEQFPTWEALLSRLEEDPSLPWWWEWFAGQVLPGNRASVLKGTLANKVPLPVPIPGWYQRTRIVFDEEPSLRDYTPPQTYCLGLPPVDGTCVEQADGISFDRAHVEVR